MAQQYRILVKDATQPQLVAYLTRVANIPGIQPNTGMDKLKAKLAEMGLEDEDHINLPDDGEADREEARARKEAVTQPAFLAEGDTITLQVVGYVKAKAKADELGGVVLGTDGKKLLNNNFTAWPMAKINIPMTRDYDGRHDVPVAVNTRQIFIPRGRDVEVAEPFVFALLNAEAIEWEQQEDGGNMIPMMIQRHGMAVKEIPAYTVVAPARPVAQAA